MPSCLARSVPHRVNAHFSVFTAAALPPLLQLRDLTRVSSSQQLLNSIVYDSMQPAAAACQGSQGFQDQSSVQQAPATGSSSVAPGVLQFDSQLEGGNLRMAVHVRDNEYDLFMSNDLNDRWVPPSSAGLCCCDWWQ
jgi:hypothetical protein